MKIRTKRVLSFVGATVLTFGLQSQQIFARPYVNRDFHNHSYRSSYQDVDRYYNCYKWNYDDYIRPEERPVEKPEERPVERPEDNSSISIFEMKVVELTNAERARQGLPALKIDSELSKVAKLKSLDMYDRAYFDHNSPTYGSPFDMMRQFGVSYRSAGENIAKGQRSPEAVVNAWMNSEGHRKNIMGNYTHIGVGYIENGNVWTQMFIGK